ncbi:MAG: N-acetylmuramoyl-L-alanine amidase [Bacteroidales bacterium]
MLTANTLPLYVKRAVTVFLTLLFSYFYTAAQPANNLSGGINNRIRTVVIDAGHGGKDSGALGVISMEKDIALNIALKVGALIEEYLTDVEVIYTRTTDVFVELHERAGIANRAEADLFISIHVNANKNHTPYGTSSHVLGLHRTNEHFDVAVRENSVILLEDDHETRYQGFDPASLESYIIFSVMQNTYLKQSIEFASYIQDQFRERSKRKDRGVVQQGLLVLAQTSMPAVLIETGFISNQEEEKFLVTEQGQDLIASAIFRAFRKYKLRIEKNSNFTLDTAATTLQENHTGESTPQMLSTETIEQDPDNVTFRVQIASSRNLVETDPSAFKGYNNVSVIQSGKWYKYTVGHGLTYHEALDKCSVVKNDFPDAFVIAVRNKELVPLSEALIEINR